MVQISISYIIIYCLLSLGNLLIGKLVKVKPKYIIKILSFVAISRTIFILINVILK